jgi:hypothetical protein
MKNVIRLHRSHIPVNKGRRTRIRIGDVHLLFVLALLTIVPQLHAINRHLAPVPNATAAAQPAPKLVIAAGDYQTSITVNADSATDVTMDGCQQGGIMHIPAHGSRHIDNAANALCGGKPDYYLLDAPAGARSFTQLSYKSGAVHSSFKMPALGAVTPASPSTAGQVEALVNNGKDNVYVLCGFAGYEGTLAVDIFGPDAQALGSETVQCNPAANGTPTLFPLVTKFQSGYVTVRNVSFGYPGFGQTIYGAIVNSAPDNSNARVYGFGQGQ